MDSLNNQTRRIELRGSLYACADNLCDYTYALKNAILDNDRKLTRNMINRIDAQLTRIKTLTAELARANGDFQ